MSRVPIYLDNHATTRIDPRVLEAMTPWFTEKFGNAASVNHAYGWEAAEAVEAAREQVARTLGTSAKSIVFCSGATEANNLALKGVLQAAGEDAQLVTNVAEHRSVLDPARKLQRAGFEVTFLPVDEHARVNPDDVARSLSSETRLVSVMLANNEVGTINDIAAIGRICRERGVLLHVDAVQAVGRIPVDFSELHERRLSSGTLPVPLIVGFGRACDLARVLLPAEAVRIRELRERLWAGLCARVDGLHLNGHPAERLAGNLNVSFEGVDGDALMTALKDIAVSSGSACTSADPEPSHVLRAMGRSDALTRASLRFGLGRFNTADEVEFAIGYVAETVERLRQARAAR
jgi:cysteine desulfurase